MLKSVLASVILFFFLALPVHAAPRGVMDVSWFGPGLQGNPLWDNRPFDMDDPTVAAHRSLPFGTVLRLTNPDNGRSLLVSVQTRGPFVAGRELDISKGAAERLGMLHTGVKRLIVQIVR